MRPLHCAICVGLFAVAAQQLCAIPLLEELQVRTAETREFQRISEFFTGRENQGRSVILRTQSDERDGLYFFCRLSEPVTAFPPGSIFQIDVLRSDEKTIRTWEIAIPESGMESRSKIALGITGSDWPDVSLAPLAWRLQAITPAGVTIFEEKSFLWEMPTQSESPN